MDLFNREVIGYAVSRKMNAELACRALKNAVARNGKPKSLVFHSDRGSQYSSRMIQQLLEEYGIKGSMSKPGYPYDNSCVESFFASMKKEYILKKEYDGKRALSRNIFYYVEIFYNRKRLHSTLGSMSPVAYKATTPTGEHSLITTKRLVCIGSRKPLRFSIPVKNL